jgi:hypothetical protein
MSPVSVEAVSFRHTYVIRKLVAKQYGFDCNTRDQFQTKEKMTELFPPQTNSDDSHKLQGCVTLQLARLADDKPKKQLNKNPTTNNLKGIVIPIDQQPDIPRSQQQKN